MMFKQKIKRTGSLPLNSRGKHEIVFSTNICTSPKHSAVNPLHLSETHKTYIALFLLLCSKFRFSALLLHHLNSRLSRGPRNCSGRCCISRICHFVFGCFGHCGLVRICIGSRILYGNQSSSSVFFCILSISTLCSDDSISNSTRSSLCHLKRRVRRSLPATFINCRSIENRICQARTCGQSVVKAFMFIT